jgi:hypothetical protein
MIAFSVPANFLFPEIWAGGRPLKQTTIVAVPKTAINKKSRFPAPKYEIWLSWQQGIMQSITIPEAMQARTD